MLPQARHDRFFSWQPHGTGNILPAAFLQQLEYQYFCVVGAIGQLTQRQTVEGAHTVQVLAPSVTECPKRYQVSL